MRSFFGEVIRNGYEFAIMVGACLLVLYCILAGVYVALHWLWR